MMDVLFWYHLSLSFILLFSIVTFISLLLVSAPYGRHYRTGWGVSIPNRLGWILMESPAVILFTIIFFSGADYFKWAPLCLFLIWQIHYVHRTFIFPFRLQSSHKMMPLIIAFMGFAFNCLNAFVNAYWITHLAHYTNAWITSAPFIIGVAIFIVGFIINVYSDQLLLNLRKSGERGYQIPHGFLFRWVCCPNYLGEIIEWIGFAIATWSLPGLAFAIYTAANLVPRAITHQRWYRNTFDSYPADRKALIPFLL